MKNAILFLFFLMIVSCKGDHVDAPKNLVDKEKMSEVLTELVLNEQVSYIVMGNDLENGAREALKSQGVNPKDYMESYKYYVATNQMQGIIDDSQKLLLKKDPEAKKYLKEKKSATEQNVPQNPVQNNPDQIRDQDQGRSQDQGQNEIPLERPLDLPKKRLQERR